TADSVHRELEHDAVDRRPDINALELILGRYLTLDHLRRARTDLGQILADLGAHILVDLQNLQLGLGNLSLGLGNGRGELATLSDQPLLLTLQTGDTRIGNEILLPQLIDPDELLADPFDLLVLGDDLGLVAADLLPQLGDALTQLRLLAF